MSSVWLSAVVGVLLVGQPEPVLVDPEGDVPPPPVAEPMVEPSEQPDPIEDLNPPRAQRAPPARADEREPVAQEVDEDMPLRVVGAVCGGLLGCYIGQYAGPLIALPLMLVAGLGLIVFGPALLASVPPALIAIAPAFLSLGYGAIIVGTAALGASVIGTLGYQYAPAIVGSIGSRFSKGPPQGSQDVMAY